MTETTDFFSRPSIVSDTDIPITKRYLYYILRDKLSVSRDLSKGDTMRSYTVLGPRRVGKTIVLRQLHEHFAATSQYINCAGLDAATDFEMLFNMRIMQVFRSFYWVKYQRSTRTELLLLLWR